MRHLSIVAAATVSMLMLGGCATPNNGYGQARLPVGAALGAVAGGVLGSQMGQGNGKIASAAIGAAVGSYAGNEIQNQQEANPHR